MKGQSDETLPNLIRRLNLETTLLAEKYENLELDLQESTSQCKSLHSTVSKLKKEKKGLQEEINMVSKEFQAITKTFEEFLSHRAKKLKILQPPTLKASRRSSSMMDGGQGNMMRLCEAKNILKNQIELITQTEMGMGEVPQHTPDECRSKSETETSARVRYTIPSKLKRLREDDFVDSDSILEMKRGLRQLDKFKRLSRAFRDGKMEARLVMGEGGSFGSSRLADVPSRGQSMAAFGLVGTNQNQDQNGLYTRLEKAEQERKKMIDSLYGGADSISSHIPATSVYDEGKAGVGSKTRRDPNQDPRPSTRDEDGTASLSSTGTRVKIYKPEPPVFQVRAAGASGTKFSQKQHGSAYNGTGVHKGNPRTKQIRQKLDPGKGPSKNRLDKNVSGP